MTESRALMDSIRECREKLKAVNRENKRLKEVLRTKQEAIDSDVKKLKSTIEDERYIQNLLYNHLGAVIVKKSDNIEVHLKPYCSGTQQGQYIVVLITQGETAWQVVGYNLPLAVSPRQHIKIESMEELSRFTIELIKEVQAFVERKNQVTKTEELIKKVDEASIWHTTKIQTVYLTLPMNDDERTKCNIELNYKTSEILPYRVTTNISGIDEAKKERLRERMTNLLQHFLLITIMQAEYGNNTCEEESMMSSLYE